MTPLRKRMTEELQLRNLSATTVHTYLSSVERFARYFRKSPETLGAAQVRDYRLHLKNDRKVQPNTVLVNRSVLRFLYVNTLKQVWFDDQAPMPKRRPGPPGQLSAEEITRILDHTTNLKHWTTERPIVCTTGSLWCRILSPKLSCAIANALDSRPPKPINPRTVQPG
jgi:integrase/recombinase XerD